MAQRGSEWRKWDLHFHTPSSYDYADKSVTNVDIINGLYQNDISVIAITDHHCIDVERIKDLQLLGVEKGITVLPGIEFLSETRGSEPIHFIGIFSEKCDIQFVWDQIRNRTNIRKIQGENKAANEVYCDLEETAKLVHELGGITTIHAGKKSNGIENITNSLPHAVAQKEDIVKVIDVFELGKEEDQEPYRSLVNPHLSKTIGKTLPLIICSDNHNIRNYLAKQNLWIKADKTFEGLKQIIFEPEQRVKIQASKPDYKEDKLIIDEVKFHSSNNTFNPEPIKLSQNLNVIIGGKSSGKSILLYHIAKTLETNGEVDEKYDLSTKDVFFDFEVRSLSGVSQKLNDKTETSIIPNIKYIPQNYLSQLAEAKANKKGGELLSYVRGLLLEDELYKQKYDDFLTEVKSNDRKREDLIDRYFSLRKQLVEKTNDLKQQGSLEVLTKSVTTNTARVAELKKGIGLTPQQVRDYNLKKEQLDKINEERSTIAKDFREVNQFNKDTIDLLFDLQKRRKILELSLINRQIKQEFANQYAFLDSALTEISNWVDNHQISEGKFIKENSIGNLLKSNSEQKSQLEKELEPLIKDEKVKKEIADIEKIIVSDNSKIALVQRLNREIQTIREEIEKEKKALFDLYLTNYQSYQTIVDGLKDRTLLPGENKLKIIGNPKFNAHKFKNAILEMSDGRSFRENNYSLFQEKENLIVFDPENHLLQLKELFSAIVEKQTHVLSSKTNMQSAIRVLLDDYFVDYWETMYEGDKMEEMSTGKASFVILMLIVGLSSSKAPILIDQPEDNLDNRSITKDLVTYLRDKKLERQIILVTHNPNIVVNADAENVIVAHQKGQNDKETSSIYTFDYVNGAIENSEPKNDGEKDLLKSMGIREHIADIVEGGMEAFKKREEKYGIKKSF
jgi:predicted ATPase